MSPKWPEGTKFVTWPEVWKDPIFKKEDPVENKESYRTPAVQAPSAPLEPTSLDMKAKLDEVSAKVRQTKSSITALQEEKDAINRQIADAQNSLKALETEFNNYSVRMLELIKAGR